MNTMQITFKDASLLNSAKRLFANMNGVVSISVKREKKQDDTLMSKVDYFAMINERIEEYERTGEAVTYTPELKQKWFGAL